MRELDHLRVELTGRNLIEASAGTGKTYAITALYLRLLVETGLTPEQILVVTYTEAATEELRGRIRNRLRQALELYAGAPTDDPFLMGLIANENGRGPDPGTARDRLERGLTSFDTAAIFTIHGFCLRALQDNAFESGSLYDTELVAEQTPLLQEVVDDFWRHRFFGSHSRLLGAALRQRITPETLLGFLRNMVGNPHLEVVPAFTPEQIACLEQECLAHFTALKDLWGAERAEIRSILYDHKGLSRSEANYRHDRLPMLLDGMDTYLEGTNPFDLCECFEKLCCDHLLSQQLKKHAPPEHRIFDLCQRLQDGVSRRLLALKWELLEFARQQLPERKRHGNIRFFDDLLNDLHTALEGESGDLLAARLQGSYRAALIDEFQDTDPVQYLIFSRMYRGSEDPLFLIGDPKQAIYSFRGADIFAYLQAAAEVPPEKRFTLTSNWRSTPGLLYAFETIFTRSERPFLFSGIDFHPVRPGRPDMVPGLLISVDPAPLQIWHIPSDEGDKAVTVGRANELIPRAVAGEIARLLSDGQAGKTLLHGRELVPEDVAVIVRSHRQAGMIQEALQEAGIPCVMRSDATIFATREAGQVLAILAALADPGNEARLRAALVTDIFGKSGNEIAALLEDETGWEKTLETFREYQQTWLERGFMVMSQRLLSCEGVRGRLLRRPDGDRRLTNLLHCFELLHHAATERRLGMEGLLAWFGERVGEQSAAEEYQIRLETDEKAVKIVTIHVSKGLEYPVIFCPFLWGGGNNSGDIVACHDGFRMIKDYGSPNLDRNRMRSRQEGLAENLRLLYVALTRARERCYFVGGKVSDRSGKNAPEISALAYLLHATGRLQEPDPVGDLAEQVSPLSIQTMVQQLENVASRGKGSIQVQPIPHLGHVPTWSGFATEEVPLGCRFMERPLDNAWRVASFTSFSAHDPGAGEQPDRDRSHPADAPEVEADSSGVTIFTFPRGAQAGIFLHELFENVDFAAVSSETVAVLVERGLEKHGYHKEWQPVVTRMMTQVLHLPLSSPEGMFTLAGIPPGGWLTELEFFFPLRALTSDSLAEILRRWAPAVTVVDLAAACRSLRFRPVEGMVRGFMDLVFANGGRYYVVDWKSNHLGYRQEDYLPDRLAREMERKLYPLQYLLYSVALHGYLRLRIADYDYDRHFGGVIYFFLRGVDRTRGEGCGVFRDLPPRGLIEELSRLLVDGEV